MPGLIPGASQGKGLGLEFLRHVERCSVLVHVLDCATLEPGRDPLTDLDVDRGRAGASTAAWPTGRGLVVLNKVDVPDGQDLADLVRPDLEARGYQVFEVSAATHAGPARAVLRAGRDGREGPRRQAGPRSRPGSSSAPRPSTTRASPSPRRTALFRVRGEKPERWVRQTDFANDEAVGYLADRLARLGVEEELVKAGARAGDEVVIGPEDDAVVFDWEPTMATGAEMLGRRGEDHRFDEPRPAAQRRRDRDAERGDDARREYDEFNPF